MKKNFSYALAIFLFAFAIIIFTAIAFKNPHVNTEINSYLEAQKKIVTEKIGIENWDMFCAISNNISLIRTNKIILATKIFFVLSAATLLSLIIFIGTLIKRHNKFLEEIIFKDSLTKFSNWNKFEIDAKKILAISQNASYAIVNFDINKFKVINDVHGIIIGNKILNHIANVINNQLDQNNEIFTRALADNFIMLIQFKTRDDIVHRINNIIEQVNQLDYGIMLSFGIYVIEDKSLDINLINARAKIAKDLTKGRHDIYYSFYTNNIDSIIKEKEIEDKMEKALEDGEFKVYLQPKFNISENKIVGAEALVRWEKNNQIISPNDFIPIFEKNGFVTKIDMFVFEKTCQIINEWIESKISPVPISVNFARLDMYDINFIDQLNSTINKYKIPIKLIELEITETMISNFSDIQSFIDTIAQLKNFGFTLSIDDFGSGYSSLNLLSDIPVDTLKLDKKFLVNPKNIERNQTIIKNIIDMANNLNINVVVEGAENKSQIEFLKSVGCKTVQGYYYSKPLPVKEFEEKMLKGGK